MYYPLNRIGAIAAVAAVAVLAGCVSVPPERVIYRESDTYVSEPDVVVIERGPVYRPPVYVSPAPVYVRPGYRSGGWGYGAGYRNGYRDHDRWGRPPAIVNRPSGPATYTGPASGRGQDASPGPSRGSPDRGNIGSPSSRLPGMQPSAPPMLDKRSLGPRPAAPVNPVRSDSPRRFEPRGGTPKSVVDDPRRAMQNGR